MALDDRQVGRVATVPDVQVGTAQRHVVHAHNGAAGFQNGLGFGDEHGLLRLDSAGDEHHALLVVDVDVCAMEAISRPAA